MEKRKELSENIKKLALVNATKDIADEVEKLLKHK
jgi:UDP-N-acetylglucosamine--N-acetylmuramyl-(pentapeptide) pyrophosphoryl-undecaprenol N-acetylglucosamine transferase